LQKNGHLVVLKWLKVNFNITKEDPKYDNNEAFRRAAENGHLHVLNLLKDTFNIMVI
jgi:hypothetical protein